MAYKQLPFGFFAFPWRASKLRFTWLPRFDGLNGGGWDVAWLGFEIGWMSRSYRDALAMQQEAR